VKKKKKSNKLHRAVTHIKLDFANQGKLTRLDELCPVYMNLVQQYIDYIFKFEIRDVDSYDEVIPLVKTVLSKRYQRCAWQQAVGIMKSFYSNGRTNKPQLKGANIQGTPNVIRLEKSDTPQFDFWLVIATLEKCKPVRIPINIYAYGKKVINSGKLCTGVTLTRKHGKWYATLVVETVNKKTKASKIIGVDLGIKNLLTTPVQYFGQFSEKLKDKIKQNDLKRRRKQKLNACLKKKGLVPVSLHNEKLDGFIKNEIGRAINLFINSVTEDTTVVLERLSISDMRFKSRNMNRILKASKIGYAMDRLKQKLDLKHIRYASVPAAYSSQQCSCCGYIDRSNRPTQEKFICKFCEYTDNADVNASKNIAKRFGDVELKDLTDFREMKPFLLERFFKRFPDARSASDRLELSYTLREIGGSPLTVNQPV
jgi:putative transposase